MRLLVAVVLVFAAQQVLAENASDALANHDHHVYASLGFTPGGVHVGVEYEYPYHSTYGLGAFFRYSGKDDDKLQYGPGVTAVGGFVRPHFQRRAWDLFVSPGFGILMIDGPGDPYDDETGIGPSLDVGVTYQLSDSMAVGAEYFQHRVWFGDDWQGMAAIDGIFFKGRMGF